MSGIIANIILLAIAGGLIYLILKKAGIIGDDDSCCH